MRRSAGLDVAARISTLVAARILDLFCIACKPYHSCLACNGRVTPGPRTDDRRRPHPEQEIGDPVEDELRPGVVHHAHARDETRSGYARVSFLQLLVIRDEIVGPARGIRHDDSGVSNSLEG